MSAEPWAAPDKPEPDEVLDCRGLRCPQPVIELARRLPALAPGTVLRVIADDPAAPGDIAAWCRMRGQELLDLTHDGQVAVLTVRRAH